MNKENKNIIEVEIYHEKRYFMIDVDEVEETDCGYIMLIYDMRNMLLHEMFSYDGISYKEAGKPQTITPEVLENYKRFTQPNRENIERKLVDSYQIIGEF